MEPALARRNLRKLRKKQSQIDRFKSRLTLRELPAPAGSFLKERASHAGALFFLPG
jgi:hypothetical protein